MSELARGSIAYTQAALGAIEWARDLVREGQVEEYINKGGHGTARRLGITAVGRLAERVPDYSVESVLGRLVVPGHKVLSIGAEAVVIDEGERVRKVITGKTEDPETLQAQVEERHSVLMQYLEGYVVSTEFSVEDIRVFRWLPDMRYTCAVQPNLNIYKLDVLEDDEFIRRNPRVKTLLRDVLRRMQYHTRETGDAYDTAKKGNVVLLETEEAPEGADKYWCPDDIQIRLLDVMVANLNDKGFVGLSIPAPFGGIWTPHEYPAATNRHVQRLAA